MKNKPLVSPISYVYFALFFISGVSGLIYESIWSQYLKQFLGHAAYAQTLVLVIYMGGMALGSWVASILAWKVKNLLFGYAVVEIAMGLAALIFHNVFLAYLDASFTTIIPFLGQPALITIYKWVSASLIILPQSMLLGATFPLMAGGILRRFPGLSGYKTSVIYFVNTFGASAGVLFSGFYLVKEWGLRGAIVTGGFIDLFVGIMIMALCLNDKNAATPAANANTAIDGANTASDVDNADTNIINDDIEADIAANIDTDIDTDTTATPALPTIDDRVNYYEPLMFVACATAMASFIYEIAWIRMLSLVLGSSTHSFELMLSAFILGLALGSFFVRNRLDRIKNTPRFLGIVQIIMGATAIMTLFTYGNMFKFMVFTIDGLDISPEGYVFYNVVSHIICMIIMLPSTICAGMVVPLVIHMLYRRGYGEATIGRVYAVNTFGGILGVCFAVWVLMEFAGLKYLITVGGAIDMALGLYVLYKFKETRDGLTKTVAAAVCVTILVAAFAFGKFDPVLASSGVFRYGSISRAKRVVGHIDGKTASITLFKSGENLVLSTNGKPDASVGIGNEHSSDEYTMSLLGLIPLSVHASPRTAAVIGMGAGMTSHYMLYDPMLERVDIVEIEPAMARLARRIGPKVANTFEDERSRIHFEDAKTFFAAQNRTYDIIVSEPSNPWVSGVSSLFSREFFTNISNYINDGGILMQWFHMYEADVTILVSILKALEESFPVYEMYLVSSDLLIVAAKEPDADISIKRDVFLHGPIAESMSAMGFVGIDDFRLLRYADQDFFRPFIHTYDTPANSDYHSFVDLFAVKHRFMASNVQELVDMREFIVPVQKIVFADTGYLSLSPKRLLPDMNNMYDIQRAKTLAQEIIISADLAEGDTLPEAVSGPVFILDYTATRPERITFAQIQSAITQILQNTLPYLSADEMREIWDIIERQLSSKEFSDLETMWLDYFKSLCYYDVENMRRLSLEIMPTDTISRHFSNQMLMASLLASSAVIRDTTDVWRRWDKYVDRNKPPASIRAARAILKERVEN